MKKTYIQPTATSYNVEAATMLAASVVGLNNGGETITSESEMLTGKKDMWGKEGMWD